jgi:ribosomal protein S18 acetylase RimI-like enzyme
VATTVRPAGPHDAKELARVAAKTFPSACPEPLDPQDIADHINTELSVERFVADLAPDTGVVGFVLEVDNETAGYCMLRIGPPPLAIDSERPVEVLRLYVLEAFHGRRHAHTLLTTALDYAREQGHDLVWLGTSVVNERAKKFYGKQGFTEAGTKSFVVGHEEVIDVVMTRSLVI